MVKSSRVRTFSVAELEIKLREASRISFVCGMLVDERLSGDGGKKS